jgi:hypothetical protein
MKSAAHFQRTGAAKKWPGVSTEPRGNDMATLSKIFHNGQPEHGTVHWLNDCIERGKTETFAAVVILNPGLAGELLRRNPDNRGIRPVKSLQFAADIKAGRWAFNGETIIISRDGLLNDGQHRCHAVIEANTPIKVIISFGVDRSSRLTVDQGAARGAADYLSMDGVSNASASATIARLLIAYEQSGGRDVELRTATNAQVLARVKADEGVAKAAHYGTTVGKRAAQYVAGTLIGFCYYVFSEIDENEADAFLQQVCTGEGLRRNDPAHTAREKLLTAGKSRSRNIAILFRAWTFYRRNMQVKPSSLNATLPLPELF